MRVTTDCYLNKRIASPDTQAACPGYLLPGETITIYSIVRGMELEGNCIWYLSTEGYYCWSGGFEEMDFSDPQFPFSGFSVSDQMEFLFTFVKHYYSEFQRLIPGFSGISVARKIINNVAGESFCLSIQVVKKEKQVLGYHIPEQIMFKGLSVPTDVVECSQTTPCLMGDKIKREDLHDTGTAGFHAFTNDAAQELRVITNYHVLCNDLLAQNITDVKEGSMNKPLFVEINGTRIGQLSAAALNNYQDTALVKVLDTYNDPVNEITGLGTITGIHALQDIKNNLQKGIHDRVVMHGAATGSVTSGTIVSFSSSQPIPYLNGQHPISMYDLIQTTRISNKGDSGSAVLDDSNRLIGLLIADDSLYSYIIPVTRILNEFNLQFL